MITFITDSLKELEHVVWPTNKETQYYLQITVIVIVLVTAFLAVLGYVYSTSLTTLRNQFDHTIVDTSGTATQNDLNNFLQQIATGRVNSGSTQSGNVNTLTPDQPSSGSMSTGTGV